MLVNQVGYLPALAKIAIVKNPAATPWALLNAKGESVASGVTIPFGDDHDSGEKVSAADFTGTSQVGTGYTIKVGNDVSHPFDIRPDLYRKLKYDALAYYYQTRSGIEIKMPYAGDPKWAHPAGHLGVKPNHGDGDVPCAPGSGCDYKLDVTGGWYDAGDHGKYIISAGISVWTLLNWWERTKVFGTSAGDFADGKMNIPENANGVPDLLDEARWELEFELKMQVPEGQPLAGMVHAKIHDGNWTQLGLAPQEDPMVRYLQPPTTAASLNLAANCAQAARVWKKIDLGVLAEVPGGRGARLGSGGRPPGGLPVQGRRRRRPVRRRPRRRRVLLGGGRALRDDRQGGLQGVTHEVAPLQGDQGPGDRRGGDVHAGDLGEHAVHGLGLAGHRPQRDRQGGRRGDPQEPRRGGRRVPGDRAQAGLPRAVRGAAARRVIPGARARSCSTTRWCSAWRTTSRTTAAI